MKKIGDIMSERQGRYPKLTFDGGGQGIPLLDPAHVIRLVLDPT